MKHVSILIPHGHTSVVNIEGTHQILNDVNSFLKSMEKPSLFNVTSWHFQRNKPEKWLVHYQP